LDSTAATALIQTLRELATTQNKTIVAVIHQPSQHVFGLFDDLLLVSQGKQMYYGPVNKVRKYMEVDMGFPAPMAGMGTAEHVLDCISNIPSNPDETLDDVEQRIQKIHQAANAAFIDFGMTTAGGSDNGNDKNGFMAMINGQDGRLRRRPRSNFLVQFRLLLQRSLREILRGKTALMVNIVQQISIALIYGGIYNMRSNNQGSIQDRFGLLSLITIGSAQLALATTVKSFPREKAIISKEMGAAKLYGTFPYFIGKALSEWPFVALMNGLFGLLVSRFTGLSKGPGKLLRFIGLLTTHGLLSQSNGLAIGAISPSIDIALALMPVVSILTFIFDGRNVSEESTPWCLKWIPKVSLMRWGYEGTQLFDACALVRFTVWSLTCFICFRFLFK
jgi:ABC-2 type transporter